MKIFYRSVLLLTVLMYAGKICAQVPTVQDCLGALSICQPVFSTPNTYLGSGNYPNEVSPGSCLMPGDFNSTWLTFTIQQSGLLEFVITPKDTGDYDFAVYNLTNATCADILTNPALSISCNSVDTRPTNVTGLGPSGTTNFEGPVYGNPFNAPLPVTAGQTYVINIENWTELPGGFTIDFSSSTADVFDSTAPKLRDVSAVGCNPSSLSFNFSEYILCSTIQDDDFTLTGPGGPYILSSVSGVGCAAGGTMEKDFTIQVSPAITQSGAYQFNLTGADGYVTDLCGNVASAKSLSFNINLPVLHINSFMGPSCGRSNGYITIAAIGGKTPYTFSVNGGVSQFSDSFPNLGKGAYSFSLQDSAGCSASIVDTLKVANGFVSATVNSTTPALCNGKCDGTASVTASGGNGAYTYSWPSGASTVSVSGLCAGRYVVTVTDGTGCLDTASATITQPLTITGMPSQKNVSCNNGSDGSATIVASGGTGTLNYSWSSSAGTSATATNLSAGNYTLVVTDQNGCTADFQFTITQPLPLIILPPPPDSVCAGHEIALIATATGGTPPYRFVWDNGAFTNKVYEVSPYVATIYSCVATDANNCVSSPEDFSVGILLRPTVNFGPQPFLCFGETWVLNAAFDGSTYLWNDGSTNPQYIVSTSGLYYVDVSNNCGTATDSANVVFHDCGTCLFLPNAFSPNGDGLNDFFHWMADCTFSNFNIKIYNRWGQLVYESSDPNDTGWDGNFKGEKCTVGTYVYEVTYSGTQNGKEISNTMKGNVTLLR